MIWRRRRVGSNCTFRTKNDFILGSGKNGDKIKSIGTAARVDLEKKLNKKVFLKLWCKVQKNWVNNPISLESFGIKS